MSLTELGYSSRCPRVNTLVNPNKCYKLGTLLMYGVTLQRFACKPLDITVHVSVETLHRTNRP